MLSTAAHRPRLHRVAPLLFVVLLALAPCAFALPPVEQQMTPEQFKAAGLDKLDAAELTSLNAWLGRTIETVTTQAKVEAKKKVEDDNRGFFNFGSVEPVSGHITGDFRGFGKGRSYTLDNGQVWKQIDEATLAGVRKTNPAVKITPGLIGNTWYLAIEGYNSRAKVERTK